MTTMIYYQIMLYTDKNDLLNGFPRNGGLKGIKWLRFSGDDKGLQFGEERDDESLVMKILMQNLDKVETELIATTDANELHLIGTVEKYKKNEKDLIELINGKYEAAIVKKYESDLNIGY